MNSGLIPNHPQELIPLSLIKEKVVSEKRTKPKRSSVKTKQKLKPGVRSKQEVLVGGSKIKKRRCVKPCKRKKQSPKTKKRSKPKKK